MSSSLRERIKDYEDRSDFKILPKVPLITIINGRSFNKTTSLIDKPFSSQLAEAFCAALIKLCQEIEGVVIGYSFSDHIIIVSRNDQTTVTTPWYNNSAQTISSVASSIATLEFNRVIASKEIPLVGSAVFTAKTFAVPNITECCNVLLDAQHQCFHSALSFACFYELIKSMGADEVRELLANKSPKDKADILFTQGKVEFNNYSSIFKRGIACYKSPKVSSYNGEIKHKFTLDPELPLFSQEKDWLYSLFKSGDIIRIENVNI